MRDLENMKNPISRMYNKFKNKFDKYIYNLVKSGYAYKVHGSLEKSGFQYSHVTLPDEIKEKFNIDSEYTEVIMQENSMGLIDTYLVAMKSNKSEGSEEE